MTVFLPKTQKNKERKTIHLFWLFGCENVSDKAKGDGFLSNIWANFFLFLFWMFVFPQFLLLEERKILKIAESEDVCLKSLFTTKIPPTQIPPQKNKRQR